jgi:hypothetical protein
METIFENKYSRTQEFHDEFALFALFRRRPTMIVLSCLVGFLFVVGVVYAVFWEGFVKYPILLTVCFSLPFVIGVEYFILYLRYKKRLYNNDIDLNHGQPFEIVCSVSENEIGILNESTGNKNSMELSRIVRVIKTKNYYMLGSKSKMFFVFKKDGFTKGTAEEFEIFLRKKGLKR